jgi:hypothetical protein
MSKSELRDQVVQLEPMPEDVRERIRKEIANTRDRPLKTWERAFLVIASAVQVLALPGLIWYFVELDALNKAPSYMSIGFAIGWLLVCWSLFICLSILIRGAERPAKDALFVYAAFGFMIAFVTCEMFTREPIDSSGAIVLIVTGVCAIGVRIQAMELRLREQMLRIELGLLERVEVRGGLDGGHSTGG